MHKKHILFFVDHKWRDLLISVYIKLLLEERGYKVTISRNGFESIVLPAVQPDVVIFNHVYEDKRVNVIKRFKKNGLKVIILPTENIPVMDNVKRLFAGATSDLSVVDRYFVWNSVVGDIVTSEKTIEPEKLRVIGVPRYDIYREPLSSMIMNRDDFLAKYKLNKKYPVITMTTNFTLAGFAVKNKEFYEKDVKQLKTDRIGYGGGLQSGISDQRRYFTRLF